MAHSYRYHFVRQYIGINDLSGTPVDNFSAVIGEDKSAELLHAQFVGQGCNAEGRTSRCKYQFHTLLLYTYQCFSVAWSYLFFSVGQCSVQVEYEEFVFHQSLLFGF